MLIDTLIDKKDNFEIVRDQIAAILVAESTSQQAKAKAAGKSPADWKFHTYTERSNPFEAWLNVSEDTHQPIDPSPLVNVWFDNLRFDKSSSNTFERQKGTGIFNIDCYGLGLSADNAAGGHKSGDQEAAFEAQRVYSLVRNILMSANYAYLDLRPLVWLRWPQAVTAFQPQLDTRPMQHVQAIRLALEVGFNETSPQVTPEVLEYVAIEVKRAEDGKIFLLADYDYTP